VYLKGEIMKYERTFDDFGGGSGKRVFESELFKVIWWNHAMGPRIRTTLEDLNTEIEAQFEGHIELDTDSKCIEQLTPEEIILIIDRHGEDQFRKGKKEKLKEIQEVLGL
jgi:hypothetical protein